MRAYGLAHIPEGENIFGGDRYLVNLRHRRLASSSAHLYDKPLASSETYTWLRTPLLGGLRRAGYDFDLLNDHALAALASVAGGELRAGTARYRVVIVPGARFMPPESADRLAELVRGGGHVVFVERVPEGAAGLHDRESRRTRVRRALESLWGQPPAVGETARSGSGTVALVADRAGALRRLDTVLPPDFRIVEPSEDDAAEREAAVENVGFVHRRLGSCDHYFVANVSDRARSLRARFAVGHRSPERLDPETGATASPLVYAYVTSGTEKATEVELLLEPFESCFVVFGAAADPPAVTRTQGVGRVGLAKVGEGVDATVLAAADGDCALHLASGRVRRIPVRGVPGPRALPGPWELTLPGRAPVVLDELLSWTELAEGQGWSGWATYQTRFEAPESLAGVEWTLDLGRVHETAEVFLNEQPLGAAWKAPRRVACAGALPPGRNHLKIEVANLWIHDQVARPAPDWRALEETFGIRWGRYGERPPDVLPPAGLLGPVRLMPSKRVVVRL